MNFHVISVFPEMILQACSFGVIGQAQKENLLQVQAVSPRAFTHDVHKTIDDRPFGGGDGMVMLAEPIRQAIRTIEQNIRKEEPTSRLRKIYLSARGRPFDDHLARELSGKRDIILLCGRYGGVDQRVIEAEDFEEVAIGDYVLSGGEIAALALIDAVGRLVPGVLGNDLSAHEESFADGFLEYPQFTRPRIWNETEVPETLMSGHHAGIRRWKLALAILSTADRRPDLLKKRGVSSEEAHLALETLKGLGREARKACGLKEEKQIHDVLTPYLEAVRSKAKEL